MIDEALLKRAAALLDDFRAADLTLVTAESCTGGLIAGCLTEIAGSSDVLERGFVTYSNVAKCESLAVPEALIARVGAVSAEVAEAMAEGALEQSHAAVAISATGIAGPSGATPDKPVGLVYLGVCRRGAPPRHVRHIFSGGREAVRRAAVEAAFALAQEAALPTASEATESEAP
jgi:nicotinamide-nucleotide amidase